MTTVPTANPTLSPPPPAGVDPTLWATVVELLPVDTTMADITGPTRALDAIEQLRDRDATTREQLAPANECVWRQVLLRSFDFAVSRNFTFNVESQDDMVYYTANDHEMIAAIAEYNQEQRFLTGHDDDDESDDDGDAPPVPSTLLIESLRSWTHLGVLFRPSQFGFLSRIQRGETTIEHAWPTDEDAYSLFHELARMKRVFSTFHGRFNAPSDGPQPVYAVLLGKMAAAVTSPGFGLLQHCGFAPHFWNCATRPVSRRWSGIVGRERPLSDRDAQRERYELFPMGDGQPLADLQRAVREWCSDWRHVRVNPEESSSPAFYIGKSELSTRWFGLVGQRDY